VPVNDNSIYDLRVNSREMRHRREEMREKTRREVESIFTLAGFAIPRRMWELANGYWPDSPEYDDVRSPWWLVQTSIGLIRIGNRKRVLSIDWEACEVRGLVTQDDVTKGDSMVHAWTVEKAVEYMRELRRLATAKETT
jgi:hypothetical protein